jgi:hypothetical protein
MSNVKVHHQRHWTSRIREIVSQLNVPTILTPDSSHLLMCFHFMCSVKEVDELMNHPVVVLLITRVGGTSVDARGDPDFQT